MHITSAHPGTSYTRTHTKLVTHTHTHTHTHNSKGLPAEPSPAIGMTSEEFEEYHTKFIESLKDEDTGRYSLGFADGLAHAAMHDPSWPLDKPYPPSVESMVQAVLEDRSNSSFELAPGTVQNTARAVGIEDRVCRGEYRFVRVQIFII